MRGGTTQSGLDLIPPDPVDLSPVFGVVDVEVASVSPIQMLNSHVYVFVAAFLVTLLLTPLVRRLAVAGGAVDHPDAGRKTHRYPVASLGGLAVFFGVISAVAISYVGGGGGLAADYPTVPLAIVIGMVVITFTGLADDIWGWDPRLKIAGQFVAAAALAIENVGVKVAAGILGPVAVWLDPVLGSENLVFLVGTPWGSVSVDLIYWIGTALIAVFVLGGCNAANLIDGLDGLLCGVVGIVAVGLLAISLLMVPGMDPSATAPSPMAGARIVLCLALLGAVLGFLPHNFNPASIFLGDCGSLLLGYLCVVIIIMFGEQGQTHLVFAGLIVFSLPILDTALTILRRWIAGTPMSAADDKHIHHRLKRILGGVKRAVLALYGISFLFAVVGVTLAALVVRTELQVRVVYAIALVLFGFIGVIAVKSALRQRVLSAGSLAEAQQKQEPPSRPANAGSRDPGDGGEGPPPEPKASSS